MFSGTLRLEHFILRHEKYVNPEDYILNQDHVTLMAIDETQAWFSISTKRNIYEMTRFPFAFMSQFWCSEKILIVSHETLHQIAEKCVGPTGNCVLINNTGRCGSTLLNQVPTIIPVIVDDMTS